MTTALKLKANNIFEPLSEKDMESLVKEVCSNSQGLVGKCESGAVVVFRPSKNQTSASSLKGTFRTSQKLEATESATFSFVLRETKYLFKGIFKKIDRRLAHLEFVTMIYEIQRRSVKRLKIPADYYAVIKLSHQNGRLIRSFGKLMDISPRGLGILLPVNEGRVVEGDTLKATLTISHRPPEIIDLRVVHCRQKVKVTDSQSERGEKIEATFFGALFTPEHSLSVFKRMNAVVMDIYRDLFGSLTESDSKPQK